MSITGDVGNLGYIPEGLGEAYINQHTAMVRLPVAMQNLYIPFAFLSKCCKEQFAAPQRGIKNSFRLTDLTCMLLPIPPLAEQQRIVAKVNELMVFCDELETAEKELDTLESQFAEYLPKSILQAAVQGKLVPQNTHDEPADKLLERIKTEKANLVKSGKLKKEKPLPPITEEEIPYDIPDGWAWCRLGEVCSKLTDGSHNPPPARSSGYPVISAKNVKEGKVVFTPSDRFTDDIGFLKENPRTNITHGDIVLGIIGGSIGNAGIFEHDIKVIAQRSIAIINTLHVNEFVYCFILSPHVQSFFGEKSSGTAQGGVYLGELKNLPLPLPPLHEQKIIVAKVNELLALCDALKAAHETPVGAPIAATVIPFPHQEEEEEPEMLMAARGAMPKAPSKALQDARNSLFED